MLKHYLPLLIIVLILCGGCSDNSTDSFPEQMNFFFSFEKDFEGWATSGTDLNNPPVEWSIQRSQDMSREGTTALKLYLANLNDAGKIWAERAFQVKPNTTYQVTINYSFASGDYGFVNHWSIITGVTQQPVKTRDELLYQGSTGNGAQSPGHKWLSKSYDFTAQSSADGKLYLSIGVWGTWETTRTYYVDSVAISFQEIK